MAVLEANLGTHGMKHTRSGWQGTTPCGFERRPPGGQGVSRFCTHSTLVSPTLPPVDQEAAQARVGTTLRGKWRLDRLLGVGGMAAVYAGSHRNGSRGAIKMLHPSLSRNADVRRRFFQEGYAANKVNHPGVVKALDEDEAEDGSAFVVLELLEGESLETLRLQRGGTLPATEVLVMLDQLLDVLGAAHAAQIVHRDIKPDNLFLTREGQLKVLDFGIARLRGTGMQSTAPGGAMGTPAFMAPEQARGESVDHRADLWAAGATAHNLLTGDYVHEATSMPEMFVALCTSQPRSLVERMPDVPPPVAHVVDRALRLVPDERWPDARSMQAGVREAYQVLTGNQLVGARLSAPPPVPFAATVPASVAGSSMSGSSSSVMPTPAAPRPPLWPVAVGLLGVLGLGGGALVWQQRHMVPTSAEVSHTASSPPPVALPVVSVVVGPVPQAPRTRLRVRTSAPCVVQLDGADVGQAPLEVPVSPGRHEVTCAGTTQVVEVAEGEVAAVQLTPPAPTASTTKPVAKPASRPDLMDKRED
ncbi:MAG: serine/threonine protein kinase [Myxococcaceae bacterium]|nr:MAG: serine/threonine protein kinase [Myxococcaceae bacterium]